MKPIAKSPSVSEVLASATFYTDAELYVMIKLPAKAILLAASIVAEISDPFCALICDKDEVTLIVPHEAPEEFAARLRDHEISTTRYRLITLDVVLPLDMVGLMAQMSAVLAAAEVPIFPLSAYSRDHLLVPEAQFEVAMQALQSLAHT